MHETAEVTRLNARLRTDLGVQPQYAWVWSEDLTRIAPVIGSDGGFKYESSATPAGLIVQTKVLARMRMFPQYQRQWVLCVEIRDAMRWMPYTAGEFQFFTRADVEPTLQQTEEIIVAIKKVQRMHFASFLNWEADMAQKAKDRNAAALAEKIVDSIPVGGSLLAEESRKPGEKSNVSFATTQRGL